MKTLKRRIIVLGKFPLQFLKIMKVVGLITEYNPFHNGHKYHIQKAKEITNADFVVVVMSGNFVQRGTPAILDKYTRTKMALMMGADIVFELPISFACASAEFFAYGAIAVLERLGFVDYLCFGSEAGSLELLEPVADILQTEPIEYKNLLNQYLKKGHSFPTARANALKDYISLFDTTQLYNYTKTQIVEYSETIKKLKNLSTKELEQFLSSSNNILGIEYLKALKQQNSKIIPFTIKREGSAYTDTNLASNHTYSSATAIRNLLEKENNFSFLENTMPKEVLSLIEPLYKKTFPICENDFSTLLYYKLRTFAFNYKTKLIKFTGKDQLTTALAENNTLQQITALSQNNIQPITIIDSNNTTQQATTLSINNIAEALTFYGDVSLELAFRIQNQLEHFTTFKDFAMKLKTKQYTLTRINRCLLHILLELPNTKKELSFIRLLGFRKESSHLLKQIPEGNVPVLTKMAHGNKLLSGNAKEDFEKEIFCSDLYNQIVYTKYGTVIPSDYKHKIIIF